MKKWILMCLMLLLIAMPAFAEGEETDKALDEAQDVDVFAGMDYTGNSTMTLGAQQLNLGTLAAALAAGGYPALDDWMFVYGGGTMAGYRDGIRWGGYGFSGEAKATGEDGALSHLVYGLGTLNIDYGFVLHEKFDIAVGGAIGGGGYELTLRKNEVVDIAQPNKIYLTNGFFVVGPRVALDFHLTDWMMLQVDATYLYGIGDKRWEDVKDKTSVVPALRMNGVKTGVNLTFVF